MVVAGLPRLTKVAQLAWPAVVWQVVIGIGRLLIALGVLVLLFVVYLLWGTDISTASHQSTLHSQFEQALKGKGAAGSSDSPTLSLPLRQRLAAGDQPADGLPIAELQIPKIGLDTVVVQGTDTNDLHLGPGHYDGTPMPGQAGNVAIAGHRTTYGAPFYNLNELGTGDTVVLTTLQGKFTYSVVRNLIVSPTDNSVLDTSSTPMLTLTTCNPRFSAAQRLIVQADLTSTPARTPATGGTAGNGAAPRSGQLAGGEGSWPGAALWGAGGVLLAGAVWFVARRRRGRAVRWLTYGAGVIPMLVLLYFFFENVNSLLPASY